MSPSRRQSVTVIVCTYSDQRWPDLTRALRSVFRQSTPAAQVVVVVDHNDALRARVERDFPQLCVVANTGRRGLSGARNTGVSVATQPVVAFLDDDAEAHDDWLERLLAPYDDQAVVGVGGQVDARWESGRPTWFPREFDWVVGCTYEGVRTSDGPVRNMLGANMSFRTAALREIGGFRSELGRIGSVPAGCEETAACIEISRRSPTSVIWYAGAAVVDHSVPGTRARWSYYRSRCWAEGVSKAQLSRLVTGQEALSSERRYASVVLPRAVRRAIADALSDSAPPGGVGRAAAVTAGLGITTAGYARGRLSTSSDGRR